MLVIGTDSENLVTMEQSPTRFKTGSQSKGRLYFVVGARRRGIAARTASTREEGGGGGEEAEEACEDGERTWDDRTTYEEDPGTPEGAPLRGIDL
jgi:hypothetical protein